MKRWNILVMIVITLAIAGMADAMSLSFVGPSYTLSDADNDGFSEHLSFGTALVTMADPVSDPIFGDAAWETIQFSDLILDPASFTGNTYEFATTTYLDGFALYDDDGTLLMDADLTVDTLNVDGGTASLNSTFEINLNNVTLGAGYTQGDSEIVDAFLYGGALNLTLQYPVGDLNTEITSGTTVISTYSGSSDPSVVPEPSTMLLLGSGIFAVLAIARKTRRK